MTKGLHTVACYCHDVSTAGIQAVIVFRLMSVDNKLISFVYILQKSEASTIFFVEQLQ